MALQQKIAAQPITGEQRPRHLKADEPSEFAIPSYGDHDLEPPSNRAVFAANNPLKANPLKVIQ
jgi:NADH-quinone oxidoreductase subunit B